MIAIINHTLDEMKRSDFPQMLAELCFFRLCQGYVPLGEWIRKIEAYAHAQAETSAPPASDGKDNPSLHATLPASVPAETSRTNTAPPQPPASGATSAVSVSLDAVKSQWKNIVAQLDINDHPLAASLIRGVPSSWDGTALSIGFREEDRFHQERINKKANKVREHLESALNTHLRITTFTGHVTPVDNSVNLNGDMPPDEDATLSLPEEPPAQIQDTPVSGPSPKKTATAQQLRRDEPILYAIEELFRGKIVE